MKRSIPFEIFGPNQTIYYDIMRLAELEKALGCSITEVIQKQDAGINFCLTALPIGMKHHYHKATPLYFAEKIEEYIANGGSLDEIAVPIIKAILASGIFGKEISDRALGLIEEAEEAEEEEKPKNSKKGTAKS
jgi:hypothetical protein